MRAGPLKQRPAGQVVDIGRHGREYLPWRAQNPVGFRCGGQAARSGEFASVASRSVASRSVASLSVARRLLRVVEGAQTTPSVPTLGRATLEAGVRAGGLLEVLDEKARLKVEQATADEIFLGPNPS